MILALGVAKAITLNCSLKTNLHFPAPQKSSGVVTGQRSSLVLSLVKRHLWCCHWSKVIISCMSHDIRDFANLLSVFNNGLGGFLSM